MSDEAALEEIAKKYGLDEISETVKRLNELVSSEDSTLEDIAKVIEQDEELTCRLLAVANPSADFEEDYVATTVEEALMRTGMGCALLLALGDPLIRAVKKTFKTMIDCALVIKRHQAMDAFDDEHFLCTVDFSGRADGFVLLRMTPKSAGLIAKRMLGLDPSELEDDEVLNDILGEIANMVVGNFKSNLCDAGLKCVLKTPVIERTSEFKLKGISGGMKERMGFSSPELDLFVDISVNPWSE